MTKLEFGDFYRFLVSLGTVLVALALILPWLFLRESFDALASVSDISELTSTAQRLIHHRQTSALWFVQRATWISGVMAFIGTAFLATGLILWWRKQRILDKRDWLKTEKLRQEVDSMGPAEIAEKVIREVEKDTEPEEEGEADRTLRRRSMVEDYFRIERIILNKLVTCFGDQRVMTHMRVRRTQYDAVVLSDREGPDAIFEIKVALDMNYLNAFNSGLRNLVLGTQTYRAATERKARGILLMVLPQAVPPSGLMDRYDEITKEEAKTHGVDIEFHFVAEDDLLRLGCSDLRLMIRGAGRVA